MSSNPDTLLSQVARRCRTSAFAALVIWSGLSQQSLAQAPYSNKQTTEGWVWVQIKEGKQADLNDRCQTTELKARDEDDLRWADNCRRLSATFVVDLLTREPWRGQVPFFGINIIGARIEGDIDLRNANLIRAFSIDQSRIEDDIYLDAARTDSIFALRRSRVAGRVSAPQLHGELSLSLADSDFKQGVNLSGAKVAGNVEMDGATIEGQLNANALQAGGSLFMRISRNNKATFNGANLARAIINGNVDMDGVTFEGDLNANALQVGTSLFMRAAGQNKATFKGVNLVGAKAAGNVEMTGATFEGYLNANALQVGGGLFMRASSNDATTFKDVNLVGAKVTGNVETIGANFEGDLNANALQVGAHLLLSGGNQNIATRFKKGGILRRARVTGNVEMTDATFEGNLDATSLQVGGALFMDSSGQNTAKFNEVSLEGAKVSDKIVMSGTSFGAVLKADVLQVDGSVFMRGSSFTNGAVMMFARIGGNLDLNGATFNGDLSADALWVGGSVFMHGSASTDRIVMTYARIGGDLDLRGATLTDLDLSGALISRDLSLGPSDPKLPSTMTAWRKRQGVPNGFTLRNAHVNNLVDEQGAWPDSEHIQLDLDGFGFAGLGGFAGETAKKMRDRGTKWWDGWIRRDPIYSPAPYQQLAAAFVAMGDPVAGDEIRYLGQVRHRETEKRWWPWVISGLFQYTAGFGIGNYTFRVIWWVTGISLAAAVYLWAGVAEARTHGPIWCFGASLARLLPVIVINKEFTDFFNDPDRKRLTAWQNFVFSVIGLLGWLLGAILIAAVSGLLQKH